MELHLKLSQRGWASIKKKISRMKDILPEKLKSGRETRLPGRRMMNAICNMQPSSRPGIDKLYISLSLLQQLVRSNRREGAP